MVHICRHQPELLSLGKSPNFSQKRMKMPRSPKGTGILSVKNQSVVFLFSEFKTLQLLDQAKFQAHTF